MGDKVMHLENEEDVSNGDVGYITEINQTERKVTVLYETGVERTYTIISLSKGKIKETQRKMAQSRMMQQVPKADVVIRNPTHFAVALRYQPDRDPAPIVLAKGQDVPEMLPPTVKVKYL